MRPSARVCAGVLLGATVTALALAGATPAVATAPSNAAATVGLASQPAWVAKGQPYDLAVDVDGVRRPDQLDIEVTVHRAVTTRSQFLQTVEGHLLGRAIAAAVRTPLGSVHYDAAGAVPIAVPLPDLADGVYPVEVVLREHDTGDEIDRFVTHLVRVPDRPVPEPLRVAWVQELDAGLTLLADGTRRIDPPELRRLSRTAASLAGTTLPLTLDIAPDTVDGLLAAGRADVVATLAQALGTGTRQLVGAPYVDADASALVASGLGPELTDQRRTGTVVLDAALGTSDPTVWSADQPVTAAAVRRLRQLGVEQLVVPDSGLSALRTSLTGRRTLARPFLLEDDEGTTLPAAVADPGLARHFTAGADQVLAAHQFLADLAVLYLDLPGATRGVVVRPPSSEVGAAFLETVADGLAASSLLRPVTVAGLFDEVPQLGSARSPAVRSTTGSPDRLPDRVRTVRHDLLGLRALTAGANDSLAPIRLLVLAAEHEDLGRHQRSRYLDAAASAIEGVKSAVHLRGGRTFRLTAREGTIPLTVVNDNTFPVTVSMELSSERLEFTGVDHPARGRRVYGDITLGPGQSSVVAVPVRARTSAQFSLRAVLRSPDGSLELGTGRFTVIATAVSGLGIALSIGAGLFLVVWWARHWRSTRRSRHLIPEPARDEPA